MSNRVKKFLHKSLSIQSLELGKVDPVQAWDDCLIQRYCLSMSFYRDTEHLDKDTIFRNKMKGRFIAVWIACFSLKCFQNWFIPVDASHDLKTASGALFHAFGLAGKVLNIPAASVCCQIGLLRFLFIYREGKRNLAFLQDLALFRSRNLLSQDKKEFIAKRLLQYYSVVNLLSNIQIAICCIITIIYGLYSAYPDPVVIKVIAWTMHTAIQCLTIYYVIPDLLIIGFLWFVSKTHVSIAIRQISEELDILTFHDFNQRKRVNLPQLRRSLDIWFNRYTALSMIVQNFDHFSQSMLFILTLTYTPATAGQLYSILKNDDQLTTYMLVPMFVSFSGTALILLSAATSISAQGKRLYIKLNKSFLVFQGLINKTQTIKLKALIEETGCDRYPSVSLTTLGGTPYDSMSFAAFIVSFVSLFLMMFDFLHQVF